MLSGSGASVVYTPAANFSGTDSFTFRVNDGSADSNVATISITVAAVNDAPVAVGGSITTNEDATAAVTLSGTDTEGSTLTFTIVTPPAHGTLSGTGAVRTYTPAANYNGPDSFTFRVNDGGVDSDVATIAIAVAAINDAPRFTSGADQTVNEDSGVHSVSGWATGITAGAADESGQTLQFVVSSDNTALFAVQPALGSNGTLTFTPAANASGLATVTVELRDGGGTANGGADRTVQTFTIRVTAVNDVPSFTRGADQSVGQDAGAKTVEGWASSISAGAPDESGQVLSFLVSSDNTALFAAQPAVDANGRLTFTPAAGATGVANVTIRLRDNGGIVNGGVDTSAAQTFTVTVTVPVKPTMVVSEVLVPEGDSGITAMMFPVTLSVPTTQTVTVSYMTLNGTAGSKDYQSSSGTLTFAPGETVRYITVAVSGDTTRENNETLAVRLTNAVGATITKAEVTGIILDDDSQTAMSHIDSYFDDDSSGKGNSGKGSASSGKGSGSDRQESSGKGNSSGKGSSSDKGNSSNKESSSGKGSLKEDRSGKKVKLSSFARANLEATFDRA
jgi:hypothetical protein